MFGQPVLMALLLAPMMASATVGKSTYAMTHPFAYKAWMEKYLPTGEHVAQENSTKLCNEWVKLCIDDGSRPFQCSGSYEPQLHSVGAYKRETGNLTLETMEGYFTQALGGMAAYDPFMELNVAFFTSDIDMYISAFQSDGVPYFASTFNDEETTYYSILVQVDGSLQADAGSMLVLELLSDSSSILAPLAGRLHAHDVPRASPGSLARGRDSAARQPGAAAKPALTMLHVSWPSSDVPRDIAYFEDVLGGVKTSHAIANGTNAYTGKLFSDDKLELRWASTPHASQGPWSVAQWEAYAASLHSRCIGCPNHANEGFDRLADQHVGGHGGSGTGVLDGYITAQIAAGMPYRVYAAPSGSPNFLYMYGPNGWGYQITGVCATASNCGTNLVYYDECTQGITGSCSTDLPGSRNASRT